MIPGFAARFRSTTGRRSFSVPLHRPFASAGVVAVCGIALVVFGCGDGKATSGGGSQTPASGLAAPSPVTSKNHYAGSAGVQAGGDSTLPFYVYAAGVVTFSLDDTADTFSLLSVTTGNITAPASQRTLPVSGTTSSHSGFLFLEPTSLEKSYQLSGSQLPVFAALEIPGRAALLRPGDPTGPVAFLVQNPASTPSSLGCPEFGGSITMQFVSIPDYNLPYASEPAYGSIQASYKNGVYTFNSWKEFTATGAPSNPVALQPGVCGNTLEGQVVSIPADAAHTVPGTSLAIPPTTIGIGPTGFFSLDQYFLEQDNSTGNVPVYGHPSLAGVIQPSSALDVASLTSAHYKGFVMAPTGFSGNGLAVAPQATLAVFGEAAGTAGTLVGGSYPVTTTTGIDYADDLSKPAAVDTTITFGAQSPTSNGLFSSATVMVPDPGGVCATNNTGKPGTDSSGNSTCSFPAVVVAGNPENKFALFLIANDPVTQGPLGIYLFQQ